MELTLDKLKILRDYGLSLGTCTEYSYNKDISFNNGDVVLHKGDVLFQLFRINELDYGVYITKVAKRLSQVISSYVGSGKLIPIKCNTLYLFGGENLKEVTHLCSILYFLGINPETVDLSFMQSEHIVKLDELFFRSDYKILGLTNFLYKNRNSIESMEAMFMSSEIDNVEIDVPFSKLKTCAGMFYGCEAENIDVSFLQYYCEASYKYFDELFNSAKINNLHIPYISIDHIPTMFNYESRINNLYSNSEVIDKMKYSHVSLENIKNFITVND